MGGKLPTTTSPDAYYGVISHDPIVVYSFSSHTCEIDPHTGKIVRKIFTK